MHVEVSKLGFITWFYAWLFKLSWFSYVSFISYVPFTQKERGRNDNRKKGEDVEGGYGGLASSLFDYY